MKHLMQLFLALSAFLISTQISIAANLQVVKTLDGRAVYCQDDRDEQMMKGNKAVSVNVASFQNLTQDLADIELQIRFVKCSDASWHLDSNPTSETYTTISLDDGNEVEVTTTYEQFKLIITDDENQVLIQKALTGAESSGQELINFQVPQSILALGVNVTILAVTEFFSSDRTPSEGKHLVNFGSFRLHSK
ncbi:MAG: hypothetical protein A2504_13970 [Bdellovibrionales bacterium RIFOXYD12_FULL_39_22]|nr:MAG: hypothetical protein A2385_00695 [Bdellovibrionales bacterium RIFOXYB1_FULL_39_21]OFZ43806.1 MAG: hypothetical protein A2485_04835 [Bdellovibrionales bacterium RIFOXYC12_FULL_39_17]OFZ48860.1 MAG: hypothetical protein A2404_18010 [Bdellovibrionales bacterium RIFOXYC1_FULL_39_130]OFZ72434.1 MAG: hypothetical protein A2451_13740 [Bdellovibrionales bacterium RIFOXYC2_FULL_39_8]OFZ76593.1 MAG: hypothetical protein A2560_06675 [Bdellovibrionales bacterium RIFOXYD1_FULL_39_84]OFZ94827.1 MAG: